MRSRINFWPGFQKLRDALASSHSAIILTLLWISIPPLGTRAKAQSHASRQWAVLQFSRTNAARCDDRRLRFIAAWATETAKWLQPQELLLRELLSQTSSFFLSLRGYAGFGPLGLVLPRLFRLSPHPSGSGRGSGPKLGRKLLYSSLSFSFRLRGVGRLALRLNNAGVGYGFFPFELLLSPFHPLLSLFEPMLPRVHPTPFCVAQVALQRSNLAFGRSKSSRKRMSIERKNIFFISEANANWYFRNSAQENGGQPIVKLQVDA